VNGQWSMVNCENDFGTSDNNSLPTGRQVINFCCDAQHALSESEVFNHSSSYQHIKGIKSNFFETPCHFVFLSEWHG